jgi:Methyltransferase FkbM domain
MISQRRPLAKDETLHAQSPSNHGGRMVAKARPRRTSMISLIFALILFVVAVVVYTGQASRTDDEVDVTTRLYLKGLNQREGKNLMKLFNDDEAAMNGRLMQIWRQRYMGECDKRNSQAYLHSTMGGLFSPPSPEVVNQTSVNQDIEPCKHTFLDLGANIGDTVGHVVDAGLPFCGDEATGLHPKYDTGLGDVHGNYEAGKWNPVSKWLYQHLAAFPSLYPEQFCVYSFEGNPSFTSRLQAIENRVMGSVPRPVRRTHFFTQSVVTDIPGPTTFFLDTFNEKGNFDGSSLLPDMYSIKRVKKQQKNVVKVTAMGYTLPQILNMTVKPTPQSHVMIKMDIEGIEYAVLNQAVDYLCELVEKHHMFVALVVELHEEKKRVDEYTKKYFAETEPKLRTCGVQFSRGDGG